jgi:hypothetical protein
MSVRRYVVKMVTSSPAWTGTVWGYGCARLSSAEALFQRKVVDVVPCSALLLIDREERKVIRSTGTDDPVKTAIYFGW